METSDIRAPQTRSQPSDVKLFFFIIVVCFVIDVIYRVVFGINFNQGQYERAGIDGIFADPPGTFVSA